MSASREGCLVRSSLSSARFSFLSCVRYICTSLFLLTDRWGNAGFPEFHEMGLNNASKILEAQGKLKGKNVKPWSTAHSLPPEERKMFEL